MSLQNKYAWAPKNISLISTLALIALLIFNKALYKIPLLEWGLGAVVFFIMMVFFGVRGRIVKNEFLFISMPHLWMVFAFALTPFAYDMHHHLFSLFKVMALTLLVSFVILPVFVNEELVPKAIILIASIWLLINITFFGAWLLGYYVNNAGEFSGLFQNRNEFSIQTVILASLLLFFVKNRFVVWAGLFASGVLVMATASIKGFVLFGFIVFYPLLLKAWSGKKVIIALIGAMFMIASYSVLPGVQERIERFVMVFTDFEDLRKNESAFLRTWLIIEGTKVVLDNPFVGVGVDNFRFIVIPPSADFEERSVGLYSHNNYIEMALNSGLVGLLLFYFPLVYVYLKIDPAHRYYVAIKTWIIFYFLAGIAMVQYDNFASIFLYCLIVFLYFYHKRSWDDSTTLCNVHPAAQRSD